MLLSIRRKNLIVRPHFLFYLIFKIFSYVPNRLGLFEKNLRDSSLSLVSSLINALHRFSHFSSFYHFCELVFPTAFFFDETFNLFFWIVVVNVFKCALISNISSTTFIRSQISHSYSDQLMSVSFISFPIISSRFCHFVLNLWNIIRATIP